MMKKLNKIYWALIIGGSAAGFSYAAAAPLAVGVGTSEVKKIALARTIRYQGPDKVSMIAFSRDGKTLIGEGRDYEGYRDTMRLWDVRTGRLKRTLTLAPSVEETGPVLLSPDQKTLARGGGVSSVELLDARTGRRKRLINSMCESPEIAFSPDGKTLATGGDTGSGNLRSARVRLWDVRTGQLRRTINGNGPIAFSPSGGLLAVSARDAPSAGPRTGVDDILLLDAASGRRLRTLPGQKDRTVFISSLAFSRSGKYLALRRQPGGTEVWDVKSGKLERTLPPSGAVTFAPNGRFLCIGSEQSITLWSPRSGALMHTLPGTYIAFSPDDAMVATGADNTLRLWNIKAARSWRAARGTMLSIVRAPAG